MDLLKEIHIILPQTDAQFEKNLSAFLQSFGSLSRQVIRFNSSNFENLPSIKMYFSGQSAPTVKFIGEKGQSNTIELINKTGVERMSPHSYKKLELQDVMNRLTDTTIDYLDHVGFDIPWFKEDIHPEIARLRELLKRDCLYYLFPSGEPWDFILPGSRSEIGKVNDPDLTVIRRPKFEIVSIDKVSIPIVQFDFSVDQSYEYLVNLFPEAIHDEKLRNMWVYLKNSYNIDICFVIGESSENDWSNYFQGHRLK